MIGAALLIAGIGILYFSGDWLVSGSTALARHLKIKPFVIAMTLVAFGTSAPELAISVNAAIKGYEGITLGNIVGSNIANILFALPIAFLIRTPATSDLKLRDKLFLFINPPEDIAVNAKLKESKSLILVKFNKKITKTVDVK